MIEMDLASESGMIEDFTVNPLIVFDGANYEMRRDPGPNDYPDDHKVLSDGNWHHYTMVGDMAANKQYVFFNGVLVGEAGYANQNNGNYDILNIKGFRLNLDRNVDISEDESIYVDNISVRAYKTNDAARDLASAITAGSLAGWANNIAGKAASTPMKTASSTQVSLQELIPQIRLSSSGSIRLTHWSTQPVYIGFSANRKRLYTSPT